MARDALTMDSFCAWDDDTLVLNLLGQPSAKRDAIGRQLSQMEEGKRQADLF